MNTQDVRDAWQTFMDRLPAWAEGEAERESVAGEIASREKDLNELVALRKIKKPEQWIKNRLKILTNGEAYDKKRIAELQEQQRQHEENNEKMQQAVLTLCSFAQQASMDAKPLRQAFLLGRSEALQEAGETLIHIRSEITAAELRELQTPPSATDANEDVVSEQHAAVLKVLLRYYPTLKTVRGLEDNLVFKEKSIRTYLKELEQRRLVTVPQGKQGRTLTIAGKTLVEKLPEDVGQSFIRQLERHR